MAERREMGALENEVMAQLWVTGRPASPASVLDALNTDLAYTTVMTILTRLWKKGLVQRQPEGRGFVYWPKYSEADLTAMRMRAALDKAHDRKAVLSRFVGQLSKRDERALREALGSTDA